MPQQDHDSRLEFPSDKNQNIQPIGYCNAKWSGNFGAKGIATFDKTQNKHSIPWKTIY